MSERRSVSIRVPVLARVEGEGALELDVEGGRISDLKLRHIHLLAAPDFLGFDSVVGMAGEHAEAVRRGLALQGLGNDLIRLFGGRSVHPVGVCVGGFHRAPDAEQVRDLVARLRAALPQAEALVEWAAGLPLPDDEQDFVSVALRHGEEYPMNEGRLVSSDGLDCSIADYERHFAEEQVAHSTALHASLHGRPYLVGPLARLNLNHDRLPEAVRSTMERCGLRLPSRNMFHSVIARAVEVHLAVYEALRLLERYVPPEQPFVDVTPHPGVGYGCTEAPRGLLWHRYELDAAGQVRAARIVPPTSQNQARIEQDLRVSLEAFGLENDDDALRLRGETVIRNYDPCISCATHFLRITVNRP
ncbi:MAG: nickel-dependent hydrogenase large subunit [Pseudolabrys sp.]